MRNSSLSLVTFFVLSLSFGLAFDSSCAAQQSDVKVVGVRVVGEGYGESEYGSAELRPFNWSSGTTVCVLLNYPSGGLIEIDEKKSVVSKWTDNKDRSVMTKKSKFSGKVVELSSSGISEDGKAAMIEITTGSLPEKGATSLKIVGEVHVASGSKTKTEKSAVTAMKKGTKFEFAGLKFKVNSAGKPKWGNDKYSIELNYSGKADALKKIVFFTKDGKPLKANPLANSSFSSFGKKVQSTAEFGFPKPVDKLIVGAEFWTDRSSQKIPLEFEVSLGM